MTNAHYHGRPRADLQHGRSKQKRSDCPLVTLALTLDAAGFPCRSEILPGNVSEPATLAEAISRLVRLLGDGPRPTVVMDAGLSTAETIAWRLHTADGESELCLWSAERQAKDDAILAKQRARFEEELQALHAGLTKKGCTKRYDKVVERLGRLKERYKRVAGQYELRVERAPAASGRSKRRQPALARAVRWQRNSQHARNTARSNAYILPASRRVR
ncbi:MAG: hypothetical protein F4173_18900 [Acidobacteriia bacterium]|nr:hypothetical protein [Terriglobia bacterium]